MLDTLAPIIRDRIGAAPYTTRWVQPRDLLSPARMDVMADYIYAKHRRLGVDGLYARHLYAAHIQAFNGAREPGSDKAGTDAFMGRFDDLLDSIERDGYQEAFGPVPVGQGNVLMDGAHRLAACLAYDKPVYALFCDVPTWEYTAQWLATNEAHGTRLPSRYMDAMVTAFCELAPDIHVATFFPVGQSVETVPVPSYIASGRVALTARGTRNLMAIMYPGAAWTDQKAALCFPEGRGSMGWCVFQADGATATAYKTRYREQAGVGNHSIHVTDTPAEATRLVHALLNDNSVDWLNRGVFPAGQLLTSDDSICIDGSTVLETYGLRRVPADLDCLAWPDVEGSHNADVAQHHVWPVSDIIYNPARHFWLGDTKVATPEVIRHCKERRGEAKDIADLELLGKRPDKPTLVNVVYAHLQRPYAEHRGNCSVAWTPEPVEGADAYAYADAFSYRGITGSLDVLLALEPHTVLPGQYSDDVYARFDKVYSFVPSVYERGGKYEHMYLMAYGQPDATGNLREVPEHRSPVFSFEPVWRKDAIVMIHGNKASSQPGEQYTARREFAEWFAAHGKTPMDVYGRPGFPGLANYRGECANKHETMASYTFALAMDNTYDPVWSAGYFTREVLDALYCGCIPILKGCYDIERYLPADCYIDLRHYACICDDGREGIDYAGLDDYLQALTSEDIARYRAAMRRHIDGSEVQRYHAHASYMRLFALCGSEPTGEWAPGLADGRTRLMARQGNHEVWSWADLSALQAPVVSPAPTMASKRILQMHKVKELGGPLPVDFLTALRDEFGCDTFIETGTASGQTAANAASVFRWVMTAELSDDLYNAALAYLSRYENVSVWHGHSAEMLATPGAVQDGAHAIVWLDAHWSGEGYARGPENCPLLRELAAIATWPVKPPVILADDMRYCGPSTVPVYADHPTSGFPSLLEIQAAVTAIDPAYQFVLYGDIGMAYLPHEGFDVSEEVRQYQRDRLGTNLASILILNHNGGDGLVLCLDSVRAYTRKPYEIIVLDNASTDGSLDYLRQQADVRLIESAVNLGCPGGRARLLPEAKGDYVVLLDNDTIVTPDWLGLFERLAWTDSRIGLLGPRSNYVSGPQWIPDVPYRDLAGLRQYAVERQEQHASEVTPVGRLVGFCLWLRRAVIDRIGNVDASFGRFGFEDDDLCRRAILAGFGVGIAEGVFVHHTGGPQAQGDPEYNRLMLAAREVYTRKWADAPTTFDHARDYIPLVAPVVPEAVPLPPQAPVGVLVFSKDRACQLDLCLSSLQFHNTDAEDNPWVVLWTASDDHYAGQYQTLAERWPGVTFRRQTTFRDDVEAILAGWEHVCFLTDDTIFIGEVHLRGAINAITEHNALGLSLRLGRDIVKGGPPEGEPFHTPRDGRLHGPIIEWCWNAMPEERGWGYPLELSSSIYSTGTIREIARRFTFATPNQLEAGMHECRHAYADRPMLCFKHSVAFSAVWNAVQAGNGWAQGMSAAEFADAYDQGRRLDWRAYDGYESPSYHALPDVFWEDRCLLRT
jgi:GT2 family glycosyltransferase